jgi:BirA family transcriptional regulator, biotin operon repressor / biotin---[acetyl-CoA-carboxylase] ligase
MYILHFPELDSTNNYAHEHLNELADSTVIVADRQTAGRGQLGKPWVSDNPENIYISIVLKPKLTPDSPLLLNMSQITGKVIAQVIQTLCPLEKTTLKPPNDVLVNHKKACGILTETVIHGQTVKGVIVGIGLNVQLTADERKHIDQPVAALQDYNPALVKATVLDQLLTAFFAMYATVS